MKGLEKSKSHIQESENSEGFRVTVNGVPCAVSPSECRVPGESSWWEPPSCLQSPPQVKGGHTGQWGGECEGGERRGGEDPGVQSIWTSYQKNQD